MARYCSNAGRVRDQQLRGSLILATQSITTQQQPHQQQPQRTGEWQNATPPSRMDERARKLVENWNSACAKLADLHDEVEAIQKAFNGLKDGQEILECGSLKVFCTRHLKRDPSTVYRMLKKANFTLEPASALEEDTIFDQAIAISDQETEEEAEDSEEEEGAEGEEGGTTKSKKKGGRRKRIDMKVATNAHYADRYMAMVGLLTNAPKDATPQEIIATMQQEAQAAYEELDAEMAQKIRVPKLVKLPDPDYTNLKNGIQALKAENDSLKQRLQASMKEVPEALRDDRITGELAAEPDRGKAADMLQKYLQTVAQRILPPRISMLGVTVSHLRLAGRGYRIEVGDWLENRNAGGQKALAKCVATAYSKEQVMPKLRDWDGGKGKWGREHMVPDNHVDYKVVTEARARELAPEAFNEGL